MWGLSTSNNSKVFSMPYLKNFPHNFYEEVVENPAGINPLETVSRGPVGMANL